eukprot:GGOE01036947.1.p1 GENE.GGOE01036947.1~~GGOE01036947.1.p1  ORF type:complete len:484 (+),score=65.45 GGOE01036947.1:49-1500(+)
MGNEPSCGYQIGRVVPNSPAHKAGLVPFFDFIQIVDNHPIEQRPATFFREYLMKSVGQQIQLKVFNTKTNTYRDVYMVPNNNWGGQGLLGCSINWEEVEKTMTYAWHILDVIPGSNADRAGFIGYRDYIVGMQATLSSSSRSAQEIFITMFQDTGDFHRRLNARIEAAQSPSHPQYRNYSILFLIYDSVAADLREVVCHFPLGCDVGNGYLHSIPVQKGDTRLPTIRTFYTGDKVGSQPNTPARQPEATSPSAVANRTSQSPASQPVSAGPTMGWQAMPPQEQEHHFQPPEGKATLDASSAHSSFSSPNFYIPPQGTPPLVQPPAQPSQFPSLTPAPQPSPMPPQPAPLPPFAPTPLADLPLFKPPAPFSASPLPDLPLPPGAPNLQTLAPPPTTSAMATPAGAFPPPSQFPAPQWPPAPQGPAGCPLPTSLPAAQLGEAPVLKSSMAYPAGPTTSLPPIWSTPPSDGLATGYPPVPTHQSPL